MELSRWERFYLRLLQEKREIEPNPTETKGKRATKYWGELVEKYLGNKGKLVNVIRLPDWYWEKLGSYPVRKVAKQDAIFLDDWYD